MRENILKAIELRKKIDENFNEYVRMKTEYNELLLKMKRNNKAEVEELFKVLANMDHPNEEEKQLSSEEKLYALEKGVSR